MTTSSHQQMRSELGRARGYGSAHHGAEHWWVQRLTAIALVPLLLWFLWIAFEIAALGSTPQNAYDIAYSRLGSPLNCVLAVLLVVSLIHHMQLGLQVVIEDYVPRAATKFFCLIAMKLLCAALALSCIVAVLSIAL